nr:uncharacterized protein LOC109775546 [Aegilops tauschii subsp. strangulata]
MPLSFGRSISFPLTRHHLQARHVRSVSLPGTTSSHPLLANLRAHITALRAWTHTDSSSSLHAGLAAMHALHAALADVLLLLESRRATTYVGDRLLDAFLLLADAHQGFQECVMSLRHVTAESRAALRRGDTGRLASASRSRRRAEKDLARLTASVSAVSAKCSRLNLLAGAEEAQMAGLLVEAAALSAAASAAVFSSAASMSSPASTSKKIAMFIPAFTTRKSTAPATEEAAAERLHARAGEILWWAALYSFRTLY